MISNIKQLSLLLFNNSFYIYYIYTMNNKSIMFKNILYNITDNGDIGNGWKYIEVINKKQEFSLPKCLYYKGKSMKDLLSYTEYVNHLDIGKDFINDFVKDIFRDCYPGSKNPICKVKENLMVGGKKINNLILINLLDGNKDLTMDKVKNYERKEDNVIYEKYISKQEDYKDINNAPGLKKIIEAKSFLDDVDYFLSNFDNKTSEIKQNEIIEKNQDNIIVEQMKDFMERKLKEHLKKNPPAPSSSETLNNPPLKEKETQKAAESNNVKLEVEGEEEAPKEGEATTEAPKEGEEKEEDTSDKNIKGNARDDTNAEGEGEGEGEDQTKGEATTEVPKEFLKNVDSFFKDKGILDIAPNDLSQFKNDNKRHFPDKTEKEKVEIMDKFIKKKIGQKEENVIETLNTKLEQINDDSNNNDNDNDNDNEGEDETDTIDTNKSNVKDDSVEEDNNDSNNNDNDNEGEGETDTIDTNESNVEDDSNNNDNDDSNNNDNDGEATTEEDPMASKLNKLNEIFKHHKEGTWELTGESEKTPANIYYFNPTSESKLLLYSDVNHTAFETIEKIEDNVYLSSGKEPFSYGKLIYNGDKSDKKDKSNIENIIHYLIARDIVKGDTDKEAEVKGKVTNYNESMDKFKRIYGEEKTLFSPSKK